MAKAAESTKSKKSQGFTEDERAAMKERAKELKAEARASKNREDGEKDVQAKIAELPEPERGMTARLHEIIKANAPDLLPKTWYGMPAYANAEGKIVCFYQPAAKFETRYGTLGFNDSAKMDDGNLFPVSYAVIRLTAAEEKKIGALVRQAVG